MQGLSVTVTLIRRAAPYQLTTQRGWTLRDEVMGTKTE